MLQTREFRAMGTSVQLLVEAPPDAAEPALAAAEQEVHRLERVLTRFDERSELCRLNRAGRLRPGEDLLRVIRAALSGRRATGGRFDPTVLPALRAAGYDRDLDEVQARDHGAPGAPVPGGGDIMIDETVGEIVLGAGVQVDLGGIAKGDAADRAVAILAQAGPAMAVVGGDLAVSGPRRDGSPWPVEVTGADGLVLDIREGGMATSGIDRRRWQRAGRPMHHIIDPTTGAPSGTDLLRATATAPSAAMAEVRATELLLLGADAALDRANALGAPAVLVGERAPILAGGLT
ncbi:MAG: FAD:protein FMN transferase [Thermoleophilia bacterium]